MGGGIQGKAPSLNDFMKIILSLFSAAAALLLSSCAEHYGYDSGYAGGYTDMPVAFQSTASDSLDSGGSQYSSPQRSYLPLNQSYVGPASSYSDGSSFGYGADTLAGSDESYRGGGGAFCGAGGYY